METNISTNCSSLPLTNSFIIRILGSLAAISVATCLLALSWLFYLKLHKQFLYRLAAYQVTASLLHALVSVCQFSFLEYTDSKYKACEAVGYLDLMAGWMKICFGCWITFHLFCFAVLLKNMRKLEPLYVISSILFSTAISSTPLITKSYGPAEWCTMQTEKCEQQYVIGVIEQIALWYGPAFLLLVLQVIAILTMMITVYYRAHRKSGEDVFGRDKNNEAFKQLLPLVAYPVLFCILIIPPLIARLYSFVTLTPNHDLLLLSVICIPAWSLSAGVSLIVHIGALKCTDIMHIVLPMVRARGTVTITEEPVHESFPQDTSRLLSSHKDGVRSSTYFSIPSDI